jgi:hypothetical protein
VLPLEAREEVVVAGGAGASVRVVEGGVPLERLDPAAAAATTTTTTTAASAGALVGCGAAVRAGGGGRIGGPMARAHRKRVDGGKS